MNSEALQVREEMDVVRVRQLARQWTAKLKFTLVEQTKVITAASELARNMLEFGGGGTVTAIARNDGSRIGLEMRFEDQGPGIADIDQAMQDGFTTGDGLGLGLGGAKRLADEFSLESTPGSGTRVTIVKWKWLSR